MTVQRNEGDPTQPEYFSVEINCAVPEKVEPYAYQDIVGGVCLASQSAMEGPIANLDMWLRGSSHPEGEFELRTRMGLYYQDDEEAAGAEEDAEQIQFLEGFAGRYRGIELTDMDAGWMVHHPDFGYFIVSFDGADFSFELKSCVYDAHELALESNIPMLRHGVNLFSGSFDRYCRMLELFVEEIHQANNYNGQFQIDIAPIPPEHPEVPSWVQQPPALMPAQTSELISEVKYPMLEDFLGNERVKAEVTDFINARKHLHALEKAGLRPPQGILLHGPAGSGKSMLVEAIANELGAELRRISPEDIYTEKYIAVAEQNLKRELDKAVQTTVPLVLFFNEFDGLAPSSTNQSETVGRVIPILKTYLESELRRNPLLVVAAATNSKDGIDQEMIRAERFDYKIYVPEATGDLRSALILGAITDIVARGEISLDLNSINIQHLTEACDGLAAPDIKVIINGLLSRRAIRMAIGDQDLSPLGQDEFIREIEDYRKR